MTTAQDAVQTLIPTLDISERAARASEARSKVETGVKLRGAEKVARIPVKIIPTTELPKKPDWIRVRIPVSPEVDRIKRCCVSTSCTACAKKPPARTWASASRAVPRPS
jgi:lipoyl synthase